MTSHKLPTAVALLSVILATCLGTIGSAANVSWIGGDGNWASPARWLPFGVPSPIDTAFIGNIGIAETDVELNQNDTIAGLQITNQMRLNTNGNNLFVNGPTTIDGGAGFFTNDSRLNILQGSIVTTQNLNLLNGGSVFLDEGRYDITGQATIDEDSAIFGDNGTQIRLFRASSPSLVNNGELLGRFDGGLILDQVSTGRIDLDGTSGDGSVLVDRSNIPGTVHSTLTINGDQLHDDFNGLLRIAQGGTANMNLTNGWTLGAGGSLTFGGDPTQLNELNGGEVTLSADVNAQGQSRSHINADAVLTAGADVDVFTNAELAFHGQTQIDGGNFQLSEDAILEFYGDTRVEGGTFNTFSDLSADGRVAFRALITEWAGTVNVNGIAQQIGDARVEGPTTINANVLDMDGLGSTTWVLESALTVNADSVDSTISNSFDGLISVSTVLGSRLTVNLNDPADHWTMAGTLVFHNNFPFERTMLSGETRARITGDIAVAGANNRVTSDFDLASSSRVIAQDGLASIVVTGQTLVEAGAEVILNNLINKGDGHLTLADGATLGTTELINEALLEIGNSPGVAAVDEFENTADGTWLVEIGGYVAGNEHDLLLVTGGNATLDGQIEVDLIDAGAGLFLPEIGDEFTVLTSLAPVLGAFANDPVSFANGQTFHWDVVHNPNDVTLVLEQITGFVPEPTTLLLAVVGVLCITLRRSGSSAKRA